MADSAGQPPSQIWQVAADVVFPNHIPMDTGPNGEPTFPEQITPVSRIPTESREFPDSTVFIAPGDESTVPEAQQDFRFAVGRITVRLEQPVADGQAGIDAAMKRLDPVLESLSFQMQVALHIQRLEAIELSGSPTVGESREMILWSSYATPTFRPTSVQMEAVAGRQVPDLGIDLDPADSRANRALDWYLKSMSAPFEADAFIFLWIAVEILAADSDLKVTEPYRNPKCGHVIPQCPECGEPTAKVVQGPSMKRFLTERYGIDADVAKRLWDARQMLHGAHAFDSKVMENLAELSQPLRAVVVAALKERLGVPAEEPPFAAPAGLSIMPYMAVQGTRKVAAEDLDPLAQVSTGGDN